MTQPTRRSGVSKRIRTPASASHGALVSIPIPIPITHDHGPLPQDEAERPELTGDAAAAGAESAIDPAAADLLVAQARVHDLAAGIEATAARVGKRIQVNPMLELQARLEALARVLVATGIITPMQLEALAISCYADKLAGVLQEMEANLLKPQSPQGPSLDVVRRPGIVVARH